MPTSNNLYPFVHLAYRRTRLALQSAQGQLDFPPSIENHARTIKPGALIEACPASTKVLETVELAQHAAAKADICFLIPPYFEARGYESSREVLRYVSDRTDIALGLFNTHAAGWILTPDECARLVDEFPAICAVKNGMFRPSHTAALHRLVPELVIWECDMLAYRGGFLHRGITAAGILGGSAYLYELPDNRIYSAQWDLLVSDKLSEEIDHCMSPASTSWWHGCTVRSARPMSKPFTRTGAPRSRPPRTSSAFPLAATLAPALPSHRCRTRRGAIRAAYEAIGLVPVAR